MNDTTIIFVVFVELSLVLGLTLLRLWYQMVMSTKLGNDIKATKMEARRIRNELVNKGDIKKDLGGLDVKGLAELFGIDPKILGNPIVKGFLDGVLKPQVKQDKGESFKR